MKRSNTEKNIPSSYKKGYLKMIKGLVSPQKGFKDPVAHYKSTDSANSQKSNSKSVKSRLKKAQEIDAFNRKISGQIEVELKDYVKEFRKKVNLFKKHTC